VEQTRLVVIVILCGGDEAGRGAILGPLVISLVSIKKSSLHKLSDIGVRDSKMLSDKRRRLLYKEITRIADDVKVDKILPSEINEAMKSKISLNELEAIRFARLFDTMEGDIDVVYLDSPDVVPEKFGIRFNLSSSRRTKVVGVKSDARGTGYTRIISEHKADTKYPIVSAASIIAKVTRDKEIARIEKELDIPIGSGYPSDQETIGMIRENLKSGKLKTHIREYWSTLDHIKQKKLTNF